MKLTTKTIHEAGTPDGLVQRCARCGVVLSDYRNSISVGQWEPHWWRGSVWVREGSQIAVDEAPNCITPQPTPGPWRVSETYEPPSGIIGADGFPVASVDRVAITDKWGEIPGIMHWSDAPGRAFIERPDGEVIANAALIAAAPTLARENAELREQLETAKQNPAILPKFIRSSSFAPECVVPLHELPTNEQIGDPAYWAGNTGPHIEAIYELVDGKLSTVDEQSNAAYLYEYKGIRVWQPTTNAPPDMVVKADPEPTAPTTNPNELCWRCHRPWKEHGRNRLGHEVCP